jgi:hypothetical protein
MFRARVSRAERRGPCTFPRARDGGATVGWGAVLAQAHGVGWGARCWLGSRPADTSGWAHARRTHLTRFPGGTRLTRFSGGLRARWAASDTPLRALGHTAAAWRSTCVRVSTDDFHRARAKPLRRSYVELRRSWVTGPRSAPHEPRRLYPPRRPIRARRQPVRSSHVAAGTTRTSIPAAAELNESMPRSP